jgi:hypothetical protein
MNIRIRLKWVIALLVVALLAWLTPFIVLIGFGISNNLDVGSAITHWVGSDSSTAQTTPEEEVPQLKVPITFSGLLENQALNECSGMAWSDTSDIIWAHNDSGGETRLYAFETDGSDLGHVDIDIPQMGDWEDMTRFTLNGEPYLLIADVGDNFRWRPGLYLFIVKEPTREALRQGTKIAPAWTIVYRYPDGYRDSEGVGVDVKEGFVYLTSKRTVPAQVFRVPLQPKSEMSLESEPLVADFVADLNGIPRPNEVDLLQDTQWGESRSMPTAMDLQSNRAVIVTYKDAYFYERTNDQSWSEAFSEVPQRIVLPHTYGRESVTLTSEGKRMMVGAERQGENAVNLFEVELP